MLILIYQDMKKLKLSDDAQDLLWGIIAAIALVLMVFFYTPRTRAQNVVRKGNVFIQVDNKNKKDSIDTGMYYQDASGNKYPIFLSTKRKAYCWLKSKKTGKLYRRYLPNITIMLKEMENGKSK